MHSKWYTSLVAEEFAVEILQLMPSTPPIVILYRASICQGSADITEKDEETVPYS